MRKFAISDIHGCLNSFKALLAQIDLSPEDELYLLGDYVDRGPDSKGVIDYIVQLQQANYTVHCLRGNHEQMLLDGVYQGGQALALWLSNGGYNTLLSFGSSGPLEVPSSYLPFFHNLSHYFLVDEYILVHAGLGFSAADPFEDLQSLIWARGWYDTIDRQWLGDRIIVHGHTPQPQSSIKQHLKELSLLPVMNIDNGCVFEREGMNQLCAFELTGRKLFFQPNVE